MTEQKKRKRFSFSMFSPYLWDIQILTKNQWLVYCCLCRWRDNDEDTCYPGVKRISREARLTKKQVQYSLMKLEELGIIQKVYQGGKGRYDRNKYRLLDLGCKD